METFPTYPFLLFDGYSVDHGSHVQRTEFDKPPGKQYRRFTRRLERRPVTYGFKTYADYQSFLNWVYVTLNGGADYFQWVEPVHGTILTMQILEGSLQSVPIDIMTTRWDVSFTLIGLL